MPFLLGSFTAGLFSGLEDTQNAFIRTEHYKQERIKTPLLEESLKQEKLKTKKMQDDMQETETTRAMRDDMVTKVGTAMAGGNPASGGGAGGGTRLSYADPDNPGGGGGTTTKGPINVGNLPKPTDMPLPGVTGTTSTGTAGVNTASGSPTDDPDMHGATVPVNRGGVPPSALNTNAATGAGATAAPNLPANAMLAGGQPLSGQLSREHGGYDEQGPNPGATQRAQAGVPTAPITTAPSNMQTYDVPMSQTGALSSGQGTPQGQTVNGPDSQPRPPGGAGPDMSHLSNKPVGSTFGDWWHNRTQPPRYLPPGQPVSQAVPTRPTAPGLASNTGGVGAQILAAMNPTAGPTA